MLKLGVVLLLVAITSINGQNDYMTLDGVDSRIECSFDIRHQFSSSPDSCFFEIFNNADRVTNRWSLHKGETPSSLDAMNDGQPWRTGPQGSRTDPNNGYYLLFDSSKYNSHDGFQPYAGQEYYVDAGRYDAHKDERCLVFWKNSNSNTPAPEPSTLKIVRNLEEGLIQQRVEVISEEAEVLSEYTLKKIVLSPSDYKYTLRFFGEAVPSRDFQDIAIDDLVIYPFSCSQISDVTGTPINVLSEWGEWTDECTGWCGSGEQYVHRECIYGPCVDASYTKSRACDTPCRLPECPAVTPLHYCNWEEYNDDSVNCFLLIADGEDSKWEIAKRSTGDSGPARDYTFRELNCDGHYIRIVPKEMESGESTYLATGKLDLGSDSEMCFQFYLSMRSSFREEEMGSFRVYIWQDFKKTVVYEQVGVLPAQDSHWHNIQIDITDSMVPDPSEEFMIVLEATKGSGSNSVIAIDDMSITVGGCTGPVKGYYTQWTSWAYENPNVTCGEGVMFHERECINPNPKPDDDEYYDCHGPNYETRPTEPCPRYGGWNQWSEWGDCTPTCGEAKSFQYRECCDPLPIPYDDVEYHCNGTEDGVETKLLYELKERNCNITQEECNTDGRWTEWTLNSDGCSAECGGGNGTFFRNCTDPPQSGLGKPCLDLDDEPSIYEEKIEECNIDPCPIHGNWTEWGEWSECSQTCGTNDDNEVFKRERSRSCTDPAPEHGGDDCEGEDSEEDECGDAICPRDGEWGDWVSFDCDVTCGRGNQTVRRLCNDPQPSPGGKGCDGQVTDSDYVLEEEAINAECAGSTSVCPIDGVWTEWTQTEDNCGALCGFKRLDAERTCTNPPPSGAGKDCDPEGLDIIIQGGITSQKKTIVCDSNLCQDQYECTFRNEGVCSFEFSHTPSRFEVIASSPSTETSVGANGGVFEEVDGGAVHYYLNYDPSPQRNGVALGEKDQSFYVNVGGSHGAMCLYFNIYADEVAGDLGFVEVSQCESVGLNCGQIQPESAIVRQAEWQRVFYSIQAGADYTIQFRVNNLVNHQDFGFDSFRFLEGVPCGEDATFLIDEAGSSYPYNR